MFSRFALLDYHQNCNLILDEDTNGNKGSLYLGDFTAALDKNQIKEKNIKTVVTAAAGLSVSYPSNMVSHHVYNILDIESYNISRYFDEIAKVIEDGLKRGSVLVHCAAGISRSAACVIAFLMNKYGWGYVEAYNFTRRKRKIICPNYGFQRQLRQYEQQLNARKQKQKQLQQEEKLFETPQHNNIEEKKIRNDLNDGLSVTSYSKTRNKFYQALSEQKQIEKQSIQQQPEQDLQQMQLTSIKLINKNDDRNSKVSRDRPRGEGYSSMAPFNKTVREAKESNGFQLTNSRVNYGQKEHSLHQHLSPYNLSDNKEIENSNRLFPLPIHQNKQPKYQILSAYLNQQTPLKGPNIVTYSATSNQERNNQKTNVNNNRKNNGGQAQSVNQKKNGHPMFYNTTYTNSRFPYYYQL